MKKVLLIGLIGLLLLSSASLSFSQEQNAGEKLLEYGLITGDEHGDLLKDQPYTRAEMMVVLSRLAGQQALEETHDETEQFKDITNHWAKDYIKYALQQRWTNGYGKEFKPDQLLTAQETAEFLLRFLGYHQIDTNDYKRAVQDAKALGIPVNYKKEAFVRQDAFQMIENVLALKPKNGALTIQEQLGLTPFAITQVKPLSDQLIEITIDNPEDIHALNSHNLHLKHLSGKSNTQEVIDLTRNDEAKAHLMIDHLSHASYSLDDTKILVRLKEELKQGHLYRVTSGTNTFNFGADAVDREAPTLLLVESTGYDEVVMTFNEAVKLETLDMMIGKAYDKSNELSIKAVVYYQNQPNQLLITTAPQEKNKLYELKHLSIADFSQNELTTEGITFAGQTKRGEALKLIDVTVKDHETLIATFNMALDPEMTNHKKLRELFQVKEVYLDEDVLPIEEAELINDAEDEASIKDDEHGRAVRLTVKGLKDATLYELQVNELRSYFQTTINDNFDALTFTGQSSPETPLSINVVIAQDHETIVIKFNRAIDATTVTLDDFEMHSKGFINPHDLKVLAFNVHENSITLTTEGHQPPYFYELIINNISDDYGNTLTSEGSVVTFVGKAKVKAIEAIDQITREGLDTPEQKIKVIFDQPIAEDTLDVEYFRIDGVGYPIAVQGVEGNKKAVILTLPKTKDGQVYDLTVKQGFKNIDLIETKEALTHAFVGKGLTAGLPRMEAVIAEDNRTLKLYFDKAATDPTIDQIFWDADHKDLTDQLKVKPCIKDEETVYVPLADYVDKNYGEDGYVLTGAYDVRQDKTNENVLVITAGREAFASGTNVQRFELELPSDYCSNATNKVSFAANSNDSENIYLKGIKAIDDQNLLLTFNQGVDFDAFKNSLSDVEIYQGDTLVVQGYQFIPFDYQAGDQSIQLAIDSMLSDFKFDAEVYTLTIAQDNSIKDLSGQLTYRDYDVTDEKYAEVMAFAGSDAQHNQVIEDIVPQMMNSQTIEVAFPVAMDTNRLNNSSVDHEKNYQLLYDNQSWQTEEPLNPFYVDYNAKERKAVLYFKTSLKNEEAEKYYVGFDKDLSDQSLNRKIKADDKRLRLRIAFNDDEPKEPSIQGYSLTLDHMSAIVTFDQPVAFIEENDNTMIDGQKDQNSKGVIAVNEFSNHAINYVSGEPSFNKEDLSDYFSVEGLDINGNPLAVETIERVDDQKVQLVFAIAPQLGSSIDVKVKEDSSKAIVGLTNNRMTDETQITLGIPSTRNYVYDETSPVVKAIRLKDEDFDGYGEFCLLFNEPIEDGSFTEETIKNFNYSFDGDLTGSGDYKDDNIFILEQSDNQDTSKKSLEYFNDGEEQITDLGNNSLADFSFDGNKIVDEAKPIIEVISVPSPNLGIINITLTEDVSINDKSRFHYQDEHDMINIVNVWNSGDSMTITLDSSFENPMDLENDSLYIDENAFEDSDHNGNDVISVQGF